MDKLNEILKRRNIVYDEPSTSGIIPSLIERNSSPASNDSGGSLDTAVNNLGKLNFDDQTSTISLTSSCNSLIVLPSGQEQSNHQTELSDF